MKKHSICIILLICLSTSLCLAKDNENLIKRNPNIESSLADLKAKIKSSEFEKKSIDSNLERTNKAVNPRKQLIISGITLVECPSGSFYMGSPEGEIGRENDEEQHKVTLTKDFYIGKYEITQAQYQTIIGTNPSCFKGDDNPVESVSWYNAKEFCDKLNKKTETLRPTGYIFDLPTEAQWEYACRAGSITSLNSNKEITSEYDECLNTNNVAWYAKNSESKTQPIGLKEPNAWGIYDMHGNVSEWCSDLYQMYESYEVIDPVGKSDEAYRVRRGGCWNDEPKLLRTAKRINNSPNIGWNTVGFRIALVKPLTEKEIAAIVKKAYEAQKKAKINRILKASNWDIQALRKAKQYLDLTGFSYRGLIKQLEFDGFTNSQATFAADNCGADWYVQALRKAKRYLEYNAFSYDGLIKQLEFDGFTYSEAEYAANNVF